MIRGILEWLEELRQAFRLGNRRYAYQTVEDVLGMDDEGKAEYYLRNPGNRLKLLKRVLDKIEDDIEGKRLSPGICVLI